MAFRNARYDKNSNRKTYSAYLDVRVIAAVDTLVSVGEFPNRSEAIEEACRRLVKGSAHNLLTVSPDELAVPA